MILKKNTEVKNNTLVSESNSVSEPENLSEKNITFAFWLSDYWGVG